MIARWDEGGEVEVTQSVSAMAKAGAVPHLAVYGAAAFAVVVWTGTPVVTKLAVNAFEPLLVGVLRSALAGLAVVPLVAFARLPYPRALGDVVLLVASALCGFVVFPIIFAVGLRYTSASHAALILVAQPVFTGTIAALVERRFPGALWLLGCAVACAGEVALIGLRLGLSGGGSFWGDLMIIAGGLSASAGYVAGSKLSLRIGTWATTLWGNLVGGIVMLVPLALWGRDAAWGEATLKVWAALAYLALFSSIIGYIAWYWALARGGIARIGAAQFAMPVGSVLLAVLVLGERLTLPLALAGLVILGGIWLAQRR